MLSTDVCAKSCVHVDRPLGRCLVHHDGQATEVKNLGICRYTHCACRQAWLTAIPSTHASLPAVQLDAAFK